MLSEEQKIEIGRMLLEGVSEEGIRTVVESWQLSEGSYLQAYQYTKQVMKVARETQPEMLLQWAEEWVEERLEAFDYQHKRFQEWARLGNE